MAVRGDSEWGKGLTMGLQVGVGVALGYFVGDWLDTRFGWSPWGTVIGMALGLAAGTYLLIKEAIHQNRP